AHRAHRHRPRPRQPDGPRLFGVDGDDGTRAHRADAARARRRQVDPALPAGRRRRRAHLRMRRLVWVLAALLAGCGGSPGDLLEISVSGGFAPAKHTIVVSADGRASCDRGPLKELPAERVIDARELEKDVADLAKHAATFPPAPDAREYTLRTKAGTV